jgi:cell division protein ZapE
MAPRTPAQMYEDAVAGGDLAPDAGQRAAAAALDRLYGRVVRRGWWAARPAGLYLHGPVGRGKTMLMDMFCRALSATGIPTQRAHFHAFMAQVHAALHTHRAGKPADNAALLPAVAQRVAARARVLCLDELHVRDVADAMILARLLSALLRAGVTLVTTSNTAPGDLYAGGLQRALFLPFIDLVRARLEVVALGGPRDYRQGAPGPAYFCPLTAREDARALFATFGPAAPARVALDGGRALEVEAAGRGAGAAAWAGFDVLCERPHGAADYAALSRAYGAVFVAGVPKMGYDRRNEAQRFMALIDVLYDAGTRVAVVAAAGPDGLCTAPGVAFGRTASRLSELARRGWV